MAQAREQDRQATARRARSAKAGAARPASTGQVLRVRADDDVTEVPVSKVRYGRIVNKSRVLGKVIAGYADAAAKAKRTGKAYMITYVVTPDGKAEAMAEAPAETPPEGSLNAAVARAKARGAIKAAEILKGPDMLTARDFGPLIGASHETVNTKRKRHEVLGLEGATRGVKYPRWQVTDTGLPLPGLPKLFEVLGEQPWTVFRFLKTPHAELGGKTALDVLKTGRVDAVDTVVGVAENQAAGAFS